MKKTIFLLCPFVVFASFWGMHAFLLSDEKLYNIAKSRLETETSGKNCKELSDPKVLESKGYKVANFGWLCTIGDSSYYYYTISVLGNGKTEFFKLSLDEKEKQEFPEYLGN